MKAERTDPTRRRPIRWGTVGLSCVLSPVAGYVAVGEPRRALYLMGAAVVYVGLAAAAALLRQPFVLYGVLVVSLIHTIVAIFDVGRLSRIGKGGVLWSRGVGAGLGALAFTAGLLLAVGRFVVEPIKSSSLSMLPTLEKGDIFFINKLPRKVGRGEIIVFHYPPDPRIQHVERVVAVGGDNVNVDEGEFLLNNRTPHSERQGVEQRMDPVMGQKTVERWRETIDGRSYTIYRRAGPMALWAGQDVPQGHLFVMGDNRETSNDSRTWGTVPLHLVKGRPLFIFWSSDKSGIRWKRFNKRVE
jgi:signal peptidase I